MIEKKPMGVVGVVVEVVAVVGESLGKMILQGRRKQSVWTHSISPVVLVFGSNHRVGEARLWMTFETHRL